MDSEGGAVAGTEAVELPQAVVGAPIPEPEPTGHAAVDAALDRLRELSDRSVDAHPDLYEDVHRGLQSVLAALDQSATG